MRILPALIVALVACTSAVGADVAGRASVIDGDTIELPGERVCLEAIDAPESRQLCTIDGAPVRCGQRAALALADHIGQRTVCEERTRDRYGRTVATCYVGDEGLGAWMVRQGWAVRLSNVLVVVVVPG